MIETKGVRFAYNGGRTFEFPDIKCNSGEQMLVLGQSGTGKTTFLHLLAGMLKPAQGDIVIAGVSTTNLSDKALDKHRGKYVGIVFQTAHFVEALTVEENLVLPFFLSGKKADHHRAKQLLERLNLADKGKKMPRFLSVGEQQRVAIARAVIHQPSVIFADEPTSALDDMNAKEVIGLLEEQAKQSGSSLMIVTHDQRLKDYFSKRITL
jgi:ABC-type lipoprotein export system ATPase subunit